jgi:predicted transcriptional regulator
MEVEKGKTIKFIKEKRKVSENVKKNLKEFARIKKTIINVLKDGPKTIPQIADATGIADYTVTYYLMTLRKYGDVETGEIDDMDEYFFYQLKQKN